MRLIAATGLLAMTASAAAESTTMFPLSAGKLPTSLAKAPSKITEALARSIDAEVSSVAIEDAAGLLGCDPEATPCIEAVSKSVKATRIVFGSMAADEDGAVKITLTRFDPGPDLQQRTFELSSSTVDGLADELVRVSAPLFGKEAPPIEDKPMEPPPDEPPQIVDGPQGKISGVTWGIMGGGAVLTGLGVVFLVQASSIADDVRAAPRNTFQEIQDLRALEDKGQTRQRVGIALTAVGAVGLGYGIYRAVTERRAAASAESTSMRLTPVPIEGGAALVLTMGVP
jgi:hypothetical protein